MKYLFAVLLSALSIAGLYSAKNYTSSPPSYNSEPVCPYPPCPPGK